MFKNAFYRNNRARDLLDAFLVSAISSLLLLRFYLYITGYPQIGGGPLHIAHMLYGGIFMMAAIVIAIAFLGTRTRQISAIIGGVGFGIFIDELGKFITEDNNYFFRPAVGIIYAVFVIMYLIFNFLTRAQKLTSREYQINVLAELEEAVAHDMDKAEKTRLNSLLKASDQKSPITLHLKSLIDALEVTVPDRPSKLHKFFRKVDIKYKRFWERRNSSLLVGGLFSSIVVFLALASIYTVYANIDDITGLTSGEITYGEEVLLAQVISSVVAGGFVLYGLTALRESRHIAFEQFRRATLINIYLTQFFIFTRVQFDALPGLIFSLVLLIMITFVLRQEARLGKRYAKS